MNYPHEIERIRVEIARLTSAIQETRERVAVIEATETLAAAQEAGGQGKEVCSFEQTRGAALVIRLENVNEYVRLRRGLRGMESERAILDAQLERRRGEFKLQLLDRQLELSELEAVEARQ